MAEAEIDMAPTAEKMLAPKDSEDSEEESIEDFLVLLMVSRVLLLEDAEDVSG